MKLAILGGGGVRIPVFIRAVLSHRAAAFGEISLFEPDAFRRETIGRLAVGLAAELGHPGVVTVTADVEAAFSGADFVFSAIRVGGDRGRVIDEEVALRRGLVGQETTGPGGCAMALRTIPVVLHYCDLLTRCAPRAVLINFTNPAGLITQAISLHSSVRAVGVCDTPGGTLERLAAFLGTDPRTAGSSYGGLNHLGWITSFTVAGQEKIGSVLARYHELQRFDHMFAAFDAGFVRRLGVIPTEYVYYFYEPRRYVDAVARAGSSRGCDVLRLNEELLAGIAKAFDGGSVADAWSAYTSRMGIRHGTYMRTDMEGVGLQRRADGREPGSMPEPAAAPRGTGDAAPSGGPAGDGLDQTGASRRGPEPGGGADPGGYEGVALRVIEGLTAQRPGTAIVNTRNGASLGFLDPDDVVEVPALIHGGGVAPLAAGELPRSARGLITQVKEYEREVVGAAASGDAERAALALALHPLVPGVSVAREMMSEYRERHGRHLAYLR